MKYMGSKNRYAKEILPIILRNRKENQYYVEPFCGGCNIIDKVSNPRIGNDFHPQLIEMWKSISEGWVPPKKVTEEQYINLKDKQKIDAITGYVGFNLSYSAKWFGGWCRDKLGKRDYSLESYKNVIRQIPYIEGIEFKYGSYDEFKIPDNSIIYCDPPYRNTTKYKTDSFDPDNWECVWQKKVNNTLISKRHWFKKRC